jgi:hypothetical protein
MHCDGECAKAYTKDTLMDIKYFSICEWIERGLMRLEQIDTLINMANHFIKALNWALFHRHTNFLLGHVPPMYSLVYHKIVGTYTDQSVAIEHFVLDSFTIPSCPAAAWVHAPLPEDYAGNPWLIVILWHG